MSILGRIYDATQQASRRLAGQDQVPNIVSHPYYPTTLQFPGFVPSILSSEQLLGGFAAAAAALGLLTWVLSGDASPVVASQHT